MPEAGAIHFINGGRWQLWTREGLVYLMVIPDLHSRRVIGWAISNRMKKDLAIRALNMAIRYPTADV